tara:strand:+ start:936 stop:1073 length:138 start_codon:yes stop_codon:yes gene_type:complete
MKKNNFFIFLGIGMPTGDIGRILGGLKRGTHEKSQHQGVLAFVTL